jgi:cytochrome c-type biogenesis protein CcmF
MLADLGYFAVAITFAAALYGAGAAAYGAVRRRPAFVESGRRAMLLTFPLISVAALALIGLLLTRQYQVAYVSAVTSNSMPTYLKITAWWGGQQGSLLFWSWLMAGFTTAASLRKWDRDREFLPWVIVITMVTLAFFLSLILFFENPFARWWQTIDGQQITALFAPAGAVAINPSDGSGLNPLLRHPGMIIHPPMLYLGFVSSVIPYAFAMAALVTGRSDDRWIRLTRRWALVAWLFLSLGLILGGRWAYDVLGWGGYWGWDPVEIAAFMPWLTGTAFLHSVMVQEKRGMLKHWNMTLIITTYSLVIFGTFLTRSGVLSSVHAFAQSSIGPMFFGFISLMLIVAVSLLIRRWRELGSENELQSFASRESLFLVNNLLFMGIAIICLWGVLFPIISELFTGQKVTVGPPFYTRATGPLWVGLLGLMGVAPLSAYGHSTWRTLGRAIWKPLAASLVVLPILFVNSVTNPAALLGYWLVAFVACVTVFEFWRGARARHQRHGESFLRALSRLVGRNRRRYGGYIIHLGVIVMAMGIIGSQIFQQQTQATLAQGEQLTLGQYTMTYDSLAEFTTDDGRQVDRAVVSVYRDGKPVGELHPRRDYYFAAQQPMTIPGVRSSLQDDFYVILVGWEPIASQGATFKVYLNPLINFVWLGGFVFIFGTIVAAWPDPEPEMARRRMRAGRRAVART